MSHNDKQKGGEDDAGQKKIEELQRAERDSERRLADLEESVKEMRKSQLDHHKWFVTVIFTLVGFFLAYNSHESRIDLRDATLDTKADTREALSALQNQVDKSVEDMKQSFKELAGESLKKPLITIATQTGFLDGQVLDAVKAKNLPMFPLFLKNIGDRQTGTLKLRFSASCDMGLQNSGFYWRPVMSNEKDLPFKYVYEGDNETAIGIAPKENLTFNGGRVLPTMYASGPTTNGMIDCRLEIFYDAEDPAVANFKIKIF